MQHFTPREQRDRTVMPGAYPDDIPSDDPLHTTIAVFKNDSGPLPQPSNDPWNGFKDDDVVMDDIPETWADAINEIRYLREQNEALRNENNDLAHEKSECKKALRYKKAECRELKQRLSAPSPGARQGQAFPFNLLRGANRDTSPRSADLGSRLARCKRALEDQHATNKDLQERLARSHEENTNLRNRLDHLEEGRKKLRTARPQLAEQNSDGRLRRIQLERERHRLQRELAQLQSQIEAQSAGFAKELQKVREEHDMLIPKISDATIRGDWECLGFAIRQLVAHCLPDSLDLDAAKRFSQMPHFKGVYMTGINTPPSTDNAATGFNFNADTMDLVQDIPLSLQEGVPVADLVVSPGILKVGNADGKEYDKEHVLVKLSALCGLAGILKAIGQDHPEETSQNPGSSRGREEEVHQTGNGPGPVMEKKTEVIKQEEVMVIEKEEEVTIKQENEEDNPRNQGTNEGRNEGGSEGGNIRVKVEDEGSDVDLLKP
ncbi:hypothetical protein VTJ49DRAFT_238 [Mycothermus thermophilus]|uniref:Uncharacterized protein n=1 Tax=Humicola insolens TaxID=85995 RepID=A0ABR3VG95_HUMIN